MNEDWLSWGFSPFRRQARITPLGLLWVWAAVVGLESAEMYDEEQFWLFLSCLGG
ncbi:MAG: hypothetical protein NZ602_03770 [Thermoguttaceae bacterium]|nr:hypothetical protein [Thermoguttaceae bacterium]MDW8037591.1 hypothetical protein [Thermoguttaceae bacterium]